MKTEFSEGGIFGRIEALDLSSHKATDIRPNVTLKYDVFYSIYGFYKLFRECVTIFRISVTLESNKKVKLIEQFVHQVPVRRNK